MADRKISALTAIIGTDLDRAADYQPIIDASVADASKNKRILVNQLEMVLISSWTFASNVAQVDFTGLAGYTDLLVVIRAMTASVSGQRQLLVSTDNGSTFLNASGDYQNVPTAGAETAGTSVFFHTAASASARSGVIAIRGFNQTTAPKIAHCENANQPMIIPTTSALNAIRVNNSAGGNLTAGNIYVYGK